MSAIPLDIVSAVVAQIDVSTPAIQQSFVAMRETDDKIHEDLQYVFLAQEIYQRHLRNCNFQDHIKSMTREQLEDRDNYTRALSIELIESVIHSVFQPSQTICNLIQQHKAAAAAAGIPIDSHYLKSADMEKEEEEETESDEGEEPESKKAKLDKKSKKTKPAAEKTMPLISCLADGLTDSDLYPILNFSAHLFTPEKLESFLTNYLAMDNQNPLSAKQLLTLDSAQLRYRLRAAYEADLSLQSSKIDQCQSSYDHIDVVIQELDARFKEYEERVREEVGLVLAPEDAPGIKANRRLCDLINRNAGSSSHSKISMQQARALAVSASSDSAAEVDMAAAHNMKRKNGNEDLSRVGAKLSVSEEWDVPADPNEPIYCLCQRVSFGQMVGCDNDDCPYEWFHYSCVGLKAAPNKKLKWYCPECAPKFPAVVAK